MMSSNNSVISTRNDPADVVNFKILLNGTAINGEYKVVSLHAAKIFNKISYAKIVIADGDPSIQDFAISSKEDGLIPGAEIEIAIGYHAKSKTIFKGLIVKHAIRAAKGQHSSLTIEAKDKAFKLARARKSLGFADQTDAEIIKSIAQSCGYSGGDLDIDAGTLHHKEMMQYNTMDWDFIVSRAEMNGMLVLTDENKLVIKSPDTNQEPVKEITYGIDVLEFESEIDAGDQLKQVKSHAWDYKAQEQSDSPEANIQFKESGNLKAEDLAERMGNTGYDLYHSGNLPAAELKAWSNAQLLKSRLAKTAGVITLRGTTDIKVGQLIKLTGFSKRFNGNVLVTGIRHSYAESTWQTDLQFGLSEEWFYERYNIIEKPAAGIVPGINGLQIGIVMQLENDPDGEDRIKIKLPLVNMNDGMWARIASLDAGKERGAFFRPEINDEVVVGFFNDDPRFPVVLGMLNSNKNPAPLKAADANNEKGFITRSKMKWLFNDERKIITVETPKGKKIEINEEANSMTMSDENQNKISLTSDGITIESVKDIAIKTSGGNVKIEGLNIESKASAKYSAQGSATTEIQSSGPTIIKGAVVNIN